MYQSVHDKLDGLFYKKFGWKVRSEGVFCTGRKSETLMYGITYIIFPKGQFKFVWSPDVLDLYTWTKGHISSRKGGSKVPDFESVVDTYRDDNLSYAIKEGNEVALKCKEYYLIDYYGLKVYGFEYLSDDVVFKAFTS